MRRLYFGFFLRGDGDLAVIHGARGRATLCNMILVNRNLTWVSDDEPVTCKACLAVLKA